MSLLRSNELRVILKESGTLTDISEKMRDFSDVPHDVSWVANTHAIYLGFKHKFRFRYFKCGTATPALTRCVLAASYWNGTGFAQFQDLVDETDGLSKSGFLVWEERPEWAQAVKNSIAELGPHSPVDGLYWVKLVLSDDLERRLEAFKFLLSDDRVLTHLNPEIMNFLPSGKENFLEQHEVAANSIVSLLKVKKLIAYREQIRNPDDWLLAASYKAIEIILAPIPGDERLAMVKKNAEDQASIHLNVASASIDVDKSEDMDQDETPDSPKGPTIGWSRR